MEQCNHVWYQYSEDDKKITFRCNKCGEYKTERR